MGAVVKLGQATLEEGEGAALDPRPGLVGVLREAPLSLLGLVGVSVFFFWAPSNAGFDPVVWYPGGLAFLALLVSVVLYGSTGSAPSRLLLAAIAALGAFAALNYASIAWADVPGVAYDGANRTLLYACIFSMFALIPWRERAAALVVGIYSTGIAVVGVLAVFRATSSSNPALFFIDGRLSEPAGYPNANAALFLTAAWPALYLSTRRWVHPVLRVVQLACAGTLLDVSLLCQSRGGVLATVIVAPLFIALVPQRGRGMIAMGAVGIATVIAGPALLHVYSTTHDSAAAVELALRHAARNMAIGVAVLVAIGAVWVWLETRIEPSVRVERSIKTVLRAGAVLAVVVGLIVLSAAHPIRHLDDAWTSFRNGSSPTNPNSRFVSLGSNRYDFYRVALDEFRHHLWLGVGSDGFAVDYVRERRSDEEPLYPHSSVLRIPAQTGLVGSALVLLLAGIMARAVWCVRRTPAWPTAAGLLVAFVYMLVHSAVDWLWEFPGLTGPAFMFAGIAVGLLPRPEAARSPASARRWRFGLLLVPPVAAFALIFGSSWLSARQVDNASATWSSNPPLAFSRLDQAARLNPLTAQPYLVAGVIATRLRDRDRTRRAFESALRRDPDNWYAMLELGVLDSQLGNWPDALQLLHHAQTLNPLEPTIDYALDRVTSHRPVSFATLDEVFRERVGRRLGSGIHAA